MNVAVTAEDSGLITYEFYYGSDAVGYGPLGLPGEIPWAVSGSETLASEGDIDG